MQSGIVRAITRTMLVAHDLLKRYFYFYFLFFATQVVVNVPFPPNWYATVTMPVPTPTMPPPPFAPTTCDRSLLEGLATFRFGTVAFPQGLAAKKTKQSHIITLAPDKLNTQHLCT